MFNKKESDKAYYEKNKKTLTPKLVERTRKWRKDHPEQTRTQAREYYETHKEQRSAHWKKYYENNRDKLKQKTKDYVSENKEEVLAKKRAYYDSHKEQYSKAHKEWLKTHKEQVAIHGMKRIANKKNSIISLTPTQAKRIREGRCFFCGTSDNIVIAHDIPVSKKGNTTFANVFSACQTCNLKMRTKSLKEMLTQLSLGI